MNEVRRGVAADATAVAALHASRIPDGFLAKLGNRFLERLYRRMAVSSVAALFVVDDAQGVEGFVAATTDTGRFYKEFLRKDGVVAAATAAGALLRAPKQVWETVRYGTGGGGGADMPRAEILAIAIAPRRAGQGNGGRLLERALTELRARGIESVRVVTAVGNDPAVRMYEGAGFRRVRRTEVHTGIVQEVLLWP